MSDSKNLRGKIVSGMVWKFGERFVAQGVSFIVSLVLARILMPEDYGIVSIINIFIMIADVFLNSGLNTALIQKKDADEIDFSTIFYCNLCLGLFLYVLLFFAAPFLSIVYKIPILKNAIRVFALRLPISSFQSIQTAYVSRRMDFKKFFFATITGTLISAVVGITMAVNGFGVWALIAQYMTNTIIDTVFLFFTVRWHPKMIFSWDRAKPLINYGSKVMCTDLIGTIFNYLGDFIVGLRYTSTDLAYYTKGKQLPTIFKSNISTTLISVLFPGISQVNDDKEKIKNVSRKSIRLLTYIIYPIMVGLIVLAKPLTILLYTGKWLPMAPFVVIVCIEAIFSIPGTIALQSVKAYGRSDLMLKTEFIKKPILLVSIIIAIHYGVYAIALTLPLNTLLDLFINGILTKKTINYKLSELFLDCVAAFIMSVLMGGIVYCVSLLNLYSVFVKVLVCFFVGVLSYLVLSIITRNEEFRSLIEIIHIKRQKTQS